MLWPIVTPDMFSCGALLMISYGKNIFLSVNVVDRLLQFLLRLSPQVIDTGIWPSVQFRIAKMRVTASPESALHIAASGSVPEDGEQSLSKRQLWRKLGLGLGVRVLSRLYLLGTYSEWTFKR